MRIFIVVLSCILFLCSCEGAGSESVSGETVTQSTEKAVETIPAEDMFTDREKQQSSEADITITLKGTTAEADDSSVTVDSNMIKLTKEATYHISGSYNGYICIEVDKEAKPELILDGVNITTDSFASIYVLSADKVFVSLRGSNSLSNLNGFTPIDDNNVDSVIFSKEDISFKGEGSLALDSPLGHGIVSKDDIVFTGGCYKINSASHGIAANDSIRISDSELDITAGKDSLHCENSEDAELGFIYIESGAFNLISEGDGISAGSYMQILDGSFDITSGGGSSNGADRTDDHFGNYYSDSTEQSVSRKGIKAQGQLLIDGGEFVINSADDGIHSNLDITVNKGDFSILSGDDGFHADQSLTVNSGAIEIKESYEGLEAYEITLNDGDIKIYATDDGINAAGGNDESGYGGHHGGDKFGGGDNGGMIVINGGDIYINARGDGIDSNGSLEMYGGAVVVSGPTVGDTSTLDYATTAAIHGGSFIGTGAVGMNACFDSSSTQGVIMISASGYEGSELALCGEDSEVILSHIADQAFNCIIISSPEIKEGESYLVNADGVSYEINMTSLIYNTVGAGMPGGMPGGGKPGGDMPGGRPRY